MDANILHRIEADLKQALLGGDKQTVETLKTIKSAIQYEAVSLSKKSEDLNDHEIETVLAREAKKRQEAFDLYSKAGEDDRAAKESAEKAIIAAYLPKQLSEEEIDSLIDEELAKFDNPTMADMGRLIGLVKARAGNSAEGSVVARLAKQKLEQK